jgi:hypothetical protein
LPHATIDVAVDDLRGERLDVLIRRPACLGVRDREVSFLALDVIHHALTEST